MVTLVSRNINTAPRSASRYATLLTLGLALGCGSDDARDDPVASAGGITAAPDASSGGDANQDGDHGLDDGFDEPLDAAGGDAGGNGGDCNAGSPGGTPTEDYDFSLVWIANSPQGTVSKIDTRTAAELARYRTGPTDDPDPSRTSVNLHGDVAVLNRREGSVLKIAARPDDCVDEDGDGTIRTSGGAGSLLDWEQDECILWHTDLPPGPDDLHTAGPRAVAWDAHDASGDCAGADARLWVAWLDAPANTAHVWRLDGTTGEPTAETEVPQWGDPSDIGPYGGAIDPHGAFWIVAKSASTLVRVDGDTLATLRYDNPDGTPLYGMAIAADGRVWVGGRDGRLWSFDDSDGGWHDEGFPGVEKFRGVGVDAQGTVWGAVNNPCGVVRFDPAIDAFVDGVIPLPGCDDPVGISVDAEGKVWIPDQDAEVAYRLDPDTYDTLVVEGLVGPYTYSDMTGAGLGLVSTNPEG